MAETSAFDPRRVSNRDVCSLAAVAGGDHTLLCGGHNAL